MSPEAKKTVIIAGIATLTVVGVLVAVSLVGRAVSPGASVQRVTWSR